MMQRPVGIEPINIEYCDIEDLQLLPGCDDISVSTFIPLKGSIFGASLLIYSQESALSICDLLLHRVAGSTKTFGELEKSALLEVANICIGNYLTAFSESLQIHLVTHQVAIFDEALLNQLNNHVIVHFSNSSHKATVKMSLNFHLCQSKGVLIFLFSKNAVNSSILKMIDSTHLHLSNQ